MKDLTLTLAATKTDMMRGLKMLKKVFKIYNEKEETLNYELINLTLENIAVNSYSLSEINNILIVEFNQDKVTEDFINKRFKLIGYALIELSQKRYIKLLRGFVQRLYKESYRLIIGDILTPEKYDFLNIRENELTALDFFNEYDRLIRRKYYQKRYEAFFEDKKQDNYFAKAKIEIEKEIQKLLKMIENEKADKSFDDFNKTRQLQRLEFLRNSLKHKKEELKDIKLFILERKKTVKQTTSKTKQTAAKTKTKEGGKKKNDSKQKSEKKQNSKHSS